MTGITRNASIDIFRGMTIAVMIFVNELASVRGLPWWTQHAETRPNVMTYVDMVFPFFLFVLGISMPIAVASRLQRNPSLPSLWRHVLLRSFYLIVLGYILANAEQFAPIVLPVRYDTWAFLALVCAALYLNVYPRAGRFDSFFKALRVVGGALVILLLIVFRRIVPEGGVAWLDPSYPEILGLIGFSYFATSLLYIPTRRKVWAPFFWLVLLTLLCVLCTGKTLRVVAFSPLYVWPFGNGSMPSIIMAGVATYWIFLNTAHAADPGRRMRWGVCFGVILLAAGRLLTPFGISKIYATPSWCLYSSGAGVLLFAALYWLCDVKERTNWASPFRAAGANTLLTYLLPDVRYFLFAAMSFTFFDTHWNVGLLGVLKALFFTALMLYFSTILTRAKVRLAL